MTGARSNRKPRPLRRRELAARRSYRLAVVCGVLGVALIALAVVAVCNLPLEFQTSDILTMFVLLGFMGLASIVMAFCALHDGDNA